MIGNGGGAAAAAAEYMEVSRDLSVTHPAAAHPEGTRARRRSPRTASFWLLSVAPPLVLMGLIFWLGTDRASAAQTRSMLEWVLQSLLPSLSHRLGPGALAVLNMALRKLGHFTGYAVLGILNARPLMDARAAA